MSWLLIVVLGASISTSEVTYAQCLAGMAATATISTQLRVPIATFCIGPNGERLQSGGLQT